MTIKLNLYQRLTHKYALGWDYLDEYATLGTATMTAPKLVSDAGIDGHTRTARVTAPATLGSLNIARAIADTLTTSGCRHEYDCCGCATTTTQVTRLSRRQYGVKLFTYYNN
jgi:hypothetical protein